MKKKSFLSCVLKAPLGGLGAFVLLFNYVHAQTPSCCAPSGTQQFAMLGHDDKFIAAHLSPQPINFIPAKGTMVTYQTPDGKKAKAFEVKADAPTNNYVFVFHEWWGLNEHIKKSAEQLQKDLGNVNVIALDLYDGDVATKPDQAGQLMQSTEAKRIIAIIIGASNYAGAEANIQTIGWCFGGTWSLQAAEILNEKTKGCVMYYGMPEKKKEEIEKINFPVLGIFANKDEWIKPELVTAFETDMKTAGKQITVKTYEADHAFANPSNPKYDKASTDNAYVSVLEFLKGNVK